MVFADRRAFLRDAVVALGCYAGLLALVGVGFPPVQAPGYLLMVGFDAVQNPLAPGLGGGGFEVAFGAYVLGLAGVAGAVAARLRRRFGPGGPLRYGLAGAVLAVVLYGLAVVLAFVVEALPADWAPVAIATVVGLVGLWLGGRLAAWGAGG